MPRIALAEGASVHCMVDDFLWPWVGSTPVLTYSKRIHAVVPPGGMTPDGMTRLLPAQVLEQIVPYLGREKAKA